MADTGKAVWGGFFHREYKKEPEQSKKNVYEHIKKIFPEASEKQLVNLFR